ncbi:RbsD/FucU family protein [Pseudonocardia sp. GCM10023141]|uniref:RbsD/FucU family protein n=1 Tax=Pseudonocardia sp. GCM10023141 TaxID=3252653 RepID=UPI003606E296
MLIGVHPLLSPDLLHALRSMGHRHDIAIVDANFPCDPDHRRVVRLDGASAADVLEAVLTVLPVETEEPASAWRMIAYDDPAMMLPIFDEFAALVRSHAPDGVLAAVEPNEFKQRAGASYVVVVTGEQRLYGGVVIRKGVVTAPDTRTDHRR